MNIYFDGVLIDNDYYTYLDNDYKFFEDNSSFKLGATACNSFTLSVDKTKVSSHPSEVKIDDGTSIFYLIVDSVEEEDYVYTYTLVVKLMLFNFDYDASSLIEEKQNLGEDCYLSDILSNMCERVNVTLDSNLTLINNIVVSWYDSTIQARKYLSYIAELQSGYACINEYGTLTIKKHKRSSVKTIDIDECSGFTLGEKKSITRVVFDDGVNYWTFGDETGSTLYLDTSNVFITGQDVVENIYNEIVGFEFYNIEVSQCPIDSIVRAGDVITFSDGVNEYPTIAQYSTTFNGSWTGGYKLEVLTDTQEETKATGTEENIKKIKSEIDRANATLKITAQQTDSNSSNISTLTQTVSGFTATIEEVSDLKTRTSTLESNVDGIDLKLTQTGGNNLLINPIGLQDNEKTTDAYGWTGVCNAYTDTYIQQNFLGKSVLLLQNGIRQQIVSVPNAKYTFSLKYKKLINLANCYVMVNDEKIELTETSLTEKDVTVEVNSHSIAIQFVSDTNDSCYCGENMLVQGEVKQVYSSNATEVITNNVTIGDGIKVKSDAKNTYTTMDADGNRVFNKTTGEIVREDTDKGTKTIYIEAPSATLAGNNYKKVGNQSWRTFVGSGGNG